VFINNEIKLRAVDEYLNLLNVSSPSEAAESFPLIFPTISLSNVRRWCKRVDILRADVNIRSLRRITVSSAAVAVRSEPWFPEAEECVFALFEEAREIGMKCSTLWFTVTMQKELNRLFPDKSADDFKAGDGWRRNFFKRRGLSMRVATNIMPQSASERVPQCLSFYEIIQQICAEEGKMDPIWGRWNPHHRFNADEVGVEFGCILNRTAEKKGAKRVWISHPKHKIELRECTFLPLFNAGHAVLECSIFLRCAPKKIAQNQVDPTRAHHGPTNDTILKLRQKYSNIDIYCQPKGYMDDITFICWFKNTFLPTCGNNPQLLVLDNLSSHCTAEIREFAALHQVMLLFSPPNCTDLIQVTDYGLGFSIKRLMKNSFLAHYSQNHVAWETGNVNPMKRKKLHVKWLSESISKFYASGGQAQVETVFGRCGLRTPLHEKGEQLRKIPGYNEEIVVNWDH